MISEDIIDGSCCELCGQFFKHPSGGIYCHDLPVTCWECWEDLEEEEKENRIKSEVETF